MPLSTCYGQLREQLVATNFLKDKLREIQRAYSKSAFLLCGTPGCGKKSALRLALGVEPGVHDLADISNGNGTKLDGLQQLIRSNSQQQTITGEGGLGGASALVLHGAEHLTSECVEYLLGLRGELRAGVQPLRRCVPRAPSGCAAPAQMCVTRTERMCSSCADLRHAHRAHAQPLRGFASRARCGRPLVGARAGSGGRVSAAPRASLTVIIFCRP